MSEPVLFDDTFTVSNVNSAKYDRVSRITATSIDNSCHVTLDVNTELYPIQEGEKLVMNLASTLSLDGSKDDAKGWREVGMGESTLADDFDYVCHGKIYRFEEGEDDDM